MTEMKVIVTNGYITKTFESEKRAIEFFGLEAYMAIRDDIHSQYSLKLVPK
jgi:hypothetical protein